MLRKSFDSTDLKPLGVDTNSDLVAASEAWLRDETLETDIQVALRDGHWRLAYLIYTA